MIRVTDTDIAGVKIIESPVHADARGWFMEAVNEAELSAALGRTVHFVQSNLAESRENVVRGLHLQVPPHAQGKLVRCISGEIRDAVVDLRPSSPTFLHWTAVTLSSENRRALWIPEGFAHGYAVKSARALVLYDVTDVWAPACERTAAWNSPAFGIDWQLAGSPVLSAKDGEAAPFSPDLLGRNKEK